MNNTNKGIDTVNRANSQGFFGVGVFYPRIEVNIGTLLRSASCFGASFVFTIGRRYKRQSSDTRKTPFHIPLYNYRDIQDFKDNGIPDRCRIVGVELDDRATMLGEFIHPERCIYLLGAEDIGLSEEALELSHDLVQIPSRHCLNVAVTGSILMNNRFLQFS